MRVFGVGFTAVAACVAIAAASATGAAKTCQFDRGGRCTSFGAVARTIDAIVRSQMAQGGGKAAIVRVDIGSRTVVNRGLGFSIAGVPATPAMHFRPGSMVIPLLTTLALQLQDEGRLNLDQKLARWYPHYPNARRVTLRMLASVTSGYPDYIQENPPFQKAELADPFRQWTDDELLHYAFATGSTACDPGKCLHYAHTNFILLGRVLQKITGESVTTMITRRFLRPLGMRQTRITKLPDIPAPVLHAFVNERGVYEESTYWSPSWGIGTGLVMTSNAGDLIKMIRAIGSGRLLSRSAERQLVAPVSRGLPGANAKIDYALGILAARGWMFQNPNFNGYYGVLGYLPARRISILVENTEGPKAVEGKNISVAIFKKLTQYLSPGHAIAG